jgi:hypothetical protein
MKYFFSVLSIFSLLNVSFSQQNGVIKRVIKWKKIQEVKISKFDTKRLIHFEKAQYINETNPDLPVFVEALPIKSAATQIKTEIVNPIYESLTSEEYQLAKKFIDLPNEATISGEVVIEMKKPIAQFIITPFRSNGGNIEKLVSFDIQYSTENSKSYSREINSTALNSVLSSGNWIKIGITGSGIYKMSASQLTNLGFNINSDPRDLRVYGNGGIQLPEKNSDYYPDDLYENAIFVTGEADGTWNEGDAAYFYAKGNIKWNYDALKGVFKHSKNLYSDTTWYFITADLGKGRRVSSIPQNSGTPEITINTYDDYAFSENDEENFLKSGRRWFGNKMEVVNNHSFNFNFDNLVGGQHKAIINLAARYFTTVPNAEANFSININGQTFNHGVAKLNSLDYLDSYARERESIFNFSSNSSSTSVTVTKLTSSSIGWVDYIDINVKRNLVFNGNQVSFRSLEALLNGGLVKYQMSNTGNELKLWDISDFRNVINQQFNSNGNSIDFTTQMDSLKEYVAFNTSGNLPSPFYGGNVINQNLHATSQVDMIIVAPQQFAGPANQLAEHHRNFDNLSVVVVDPKSIYNEFSSGHQDIAGIRNFVRMFYDRAQSSEDVPKYLLLFGDGSYDPKYRITGNTNLVPTYESLESMNPIGSFCSDDFFGLLDANEGSNIGLANGGALDIGIGRFPVNTIEEAQAATNKAIHYAESRNCLNDWRNIVTFAADDEDSADHLDQAEAVSSIVNQHYPLYNIDKIYLDAYQQVSGTGGQTYPQVNVDITNRIEKGTLVFNYAGHGGEQSLALERVITIPEINAWENFDHQTLFITATCEFSRFDNPEFTSAGEYAILNPSGGAVGLYTTVRLTFSSSNEALNRNIMDTIFTMQNGRHLRLGETIRVSKNATGSTFNNRSFALLGDPALMLAFPKYDIVTTSINSTNVSSTSIPDTLSALEFITIKGYVADASNNPLTSFNGVCIPTVFDKATNITTLQNDPSSPLRQFQLRRNIIFRGPVTVTNGYFTCSFVVPQDIQFNFGYGKISYYAYQNDNLLDAAGYFSNIIVGGISNNPISDNQGPQVRLYMNNEQFVSGGMTNESPDFLAIVEDDIGINTVGTGVGHDITAVLDANTTNPIVLNDFYEADKDNFKKGKVVYPFRNLAEGKHTISFKVWDVANNSSTASIEFIVVRSTDLTLKNVLNYPNPFTSNTQFYFEYNQPGVPVNVDIQVFTVSGKLVKTLESNFISSGFRSDPIAWNGLDDFGDKIGRGVYVYRLRVRTTDGKSAEKFEKLVILN